MRLLKGLWLFVVFKVMKQYNAPGSTERPTQKYTKFCCSKEMTCTHCLLLTTNTEQAENHKSHDQTLQKPKSSKTTNIWSQPLWAVFGHPPWAQMQDWGFSTFSLVIQLYFLNNMNITFLQIPAQAKHCHQTSTHSLLIHHCPVLTGHRGAWLYGGVLPKKAYYTNCNMSSSIQPITKALPVSAMQLSMNHIQAMKDTVAVKQAFALANQTPTEVD